MSLGPSILQPSQCSFGGQITPREIIYCCWKIANFIRIWGQRGVVPGGGSCTLQLSDLGENQSNCRPVGRRVTPPPWAWLGFRLSLKNAWSTWNHPFGIWDNKTSSLTQQKVILRALAEALETVLRNERHVNRKTPLPPGWEARDIYGPSESFFGRKLYFQERGAFPHQREGIFITPGAQTTMLSM